MTLWAIPDNSAFMVVDYEDGAAIYDRRSGQTHVLNAYAAEVFAVLSGKFLPGDALTVDQLSERLIGAFEGEPPADLSGTIGAILARFEALGLVDRVEG